MEVVAKKVGKEPGSAAPTHRGRGNASASPSPPPSPHHFPPIVRGNGTFPVASLDFPPRLPPRHPQISYSSHTAWRDLASLAPNPNARKCGSPRGHSRRIECRVRRAIAAFAHRRCRHGTDDAAPASASGAWCGPSGPEEHRQDAEHPARLANASIQSNARFAIAPPRPSPPRAHRPAGARRGARALPPPRLRGERQACLAPAAARRASTIPGHAGFQSAGKATRVLLSRGDRRVCSMRRHRRLALVLR